MSVRCQTSAGRTDLQIVESCHDGAWFCQRVIATAYLCELSLLSRLLLLYALGIRGENILQGSV